MLFFFVPSFSPGTAFCFPFQKVAEHKAANGFYQKFLRGPGWAWVSLAVFSGINGERISSAYAPYTESVQLSVDTWGGHLQIGLVLHHLDFS